MFFWSELDLFFSAINRSTDGGFTVYFNCTYHNITIRNKNLRSLPQSGSLPPLSGLRCPTSPCGIHNRLPPVSLHLHAIHHLFPQMRVTALRGRKHNKPWHSLFLPVQTSARTPTTKKTPLLLAFLLLVPLLCDPGGLGRFL